MTIDKKISSKDFLAQCRAHPNYVAKKAERDRLFEERMKRIRAEDEPVLADLRRVGLSYETVGHLVASPNKAYLNATPILLKHMLIETYPPRLRETLARSLAMKQVRHLWPIIIEEYEKASNLMTEGYCYKAGLAVALSIMVSEDTMDELIALAKKKEHGDSRVFFVESLVKSKSEHAKKAIEELANDPDLVKEIAAQMKKKKK
jgi:hypothetical protein